MSPAARSGRDLASGYRCACVDIDRYIAGNESLWRELEDLTGRAGALGGRLSPLEVERLVQLYQRVSAQLSYVQSNFADPALSARLTRLVGAAAAVVYSAPVGARRATMRFFSHTFPAAVWHGRRFLALSALLLLVPAIAAGAWFATSDQARDVALDREAQRAYVEQEFEDYYSSEAAAAFSTRVLVNNIRVSFLAFAGGVLLGVPTVLLLVFNGANIGVAAGVFHAAGRWPRFYGLILPHGLLELSAIVVAGAAGLSLGWSIIAPGDRTRTQSLAYEGRRAVTILIGLMVAFIVAGLVEGFVTPSGLPTSMRVAVGVVVAAAFWAYVVVYGRRAVALGHDGSFGQR